MFEGLFQPTHLILVLVVVLVVFGPGKLPQMGSALGESIREFKKSVNTNEEDNSNKETKVNSSTSEHN